MMNLTLFLIAIIYFLSISMDKTSAACHSKNKAMTVNKHLGSTLHFQCQSTPCNESLYSYTHYSQITGTPDLVLEAPRYTKKLTSFEHGGVYCCDDQCTSNKNTAPASPSCCITVSILPVIQWDLPKAVALNGYPVTASCSASGYPRPNVRVIIPGCDYQQNNVHIGNYTNKAVFTMNVTKNCGRIYCLIMSRTYSILRTTTMLIVENVPSCGNKRRQGRSIPTTSNIAISKDKSNLRLIATRNTENDHKAVTYARGDSVTTTTCNMMMTALLTSLLILILVH